MSDREVTLQARNIFIRAAAYIRKYGWQVSGMSSHGNPRCSMGALESAGSKDCWDTRVAKLMYKELYEELSGLTLTEFNKKHQDGEKVAKLFEQTAKTLTPS